MTKKIVAIISVIMIVAVLSVCLIACVPSSAEKAKDKLEDAGYKVSIIDPETILGKNAKATDYLLAAKGSNVVSAALSGEYVVALWFETKDDAKEYYNTLVGEKDEEDKIVKISGKCVYTASSEECIKDFE